jgi:hypothetical protein
MRALGRAAEVEGRIYLTGGATAVLFGWRSSTIDIDIKMVPEQDRIYREIVDLKDRLQMNVELAAPDLFLPELPGWRERSPFIAREGLLSFHHYDPYSQALAKIERGHTRDVSDVKAMMERGITNRVLLASLFEQIESQLYRYPAVDPASFRQAVELITSLEATPENT